MCVDDSVIQPMTREVSDLMFLFVLTCRSNTCRNSGGQSLRRWWICICVLVGVDVVENREEDGPGSVVVRSLLIVCWYITQLA